MAMLWRLEATKRQKMALNAVFSLGLLVVAAGIVRTYYLERLGKAVDIPWVRTINPSQAFFDTH